MSNYQRNDKNLILIQKWIFLNQNYLKNAILAQNRNPYAATFDKFSTNPDGPF